MYTYSSIFYKCRVNDEITEMTSDHKIAPLTQIKKRGLKMSLLYSKDTMHCKKWLAIFPSPAGMSPTLFYSVGEFCRSDSKTKNVVILATLFVQSSSHRHIDADKAKWTLEQSCSVVSHIILSYFLSLSNSIFADYVMSSLLRSVETADSGGDRMTACPGGWNTREKRRVSLADSVGLPTHNSGCWEKAQRFCGYLPI